MKMLLKPIMTLTLIFFINLSCSKDGPSGTEQPGTGELSVTQGTAKAEDFVEFPGEIGIALDARAIARKGYKPTEVSIKVNASNGDFTQTVPIDTISFLAELKIPLKGLNDKAKDELTKGVEIIPEFKDVNGNTIFLGDPKDVLFKSNPDVQIINANSLEETQENLTLNLSEASTYYIQRMNTDGTPDGGAMRYLSSTTYNNIITANISNFDGTETDRIFTFVAIPNEFNTFAIRLKSNGRFVRITPLSEFNGAVTHRAPNLSPLNTFSDVQNASNYNDYKFKFEKTENGSYIINSYDGLPIKQAEGYGLTLENTVSNVQSENRTWRVISTSIVWTVASSGTTFLEPILPNPTTGFSFNSTLTNCGNGNLSQTVGANITETRTETVGWEDTFSASTSNTINVSATVEVGFEAGFFGNTANYKASVTAGYEHSWSATTENSKWGDKTTTEEQTLFTERTVTVPSGSASLVYDVYQFYPETKVNFVQSFLITGEDSVTGKALSGKEIRTQFVFNKFGGVITGVNKNSINISLKGTLTLDKLIKTESSVQDVAPICN